jgi:hypothetical protein
MEYFGHNAPSFPASYNGTPATWYTLTASWQGDSYSWTCPGTGTKQLTALQAFVKTNGGTPGNIRMALYDTSDNLIAEGASEITVDNTTAQWIGHTSFLDSNGNPATINLTGGTTYRFAFSTDSNDVVIYYHDTAGSSGDQKYQTVDYTGGFPDPYSGGRNQAYNIGGRVKVTSATCKSKGLPWLMLLLDDEESVNLTCDSNDLLPCDNRSDCVAVGGYWWSDNFCRGVSESETVESANGRIWMDRNLGASRVPTSLTDSEAYGDLYQWGRDADGHQIRTSVTTSVLSSIDDPNHGFFITKTTLPYDWRAPQNDNLWQGVAGTNNACPAGFRLPTITEWEAERVSWSSNDSAGAFGSPLKLVAAGRRDSNGSLNGVGGLGYYWSATVGGTWARSLGFGSSASVGASVGYYKSRASGSSLRCIMD